MKLTTYGRKEWGTALAILIAVLAILIVLIAFGILKIIPAILLFIFACIICFCACAFFRDPYRKIPEIPNAILSPADGVIKDIELIKSESLEYDELRNLFGNRDVLRVGIFLSVFNVHLNRAPWEMIIQFKSYRPGKYLDARDQNASKVNESMLVGAIGEFHGEKFPIAVRQVSGAIARRIVCPVQPGQHFATGQRYGMIKFGSRTELYVPAGMGFEIAVNIGDRVTAGTSVMCFIRDEAQQKLAEYAKEMAEKMI